MVVLALLLVEFNPVQTDRPAFAITHVNIIPMDRPSENVLQDQTVIVSGKTIAQIGPAGRITIPKRAIVIDGKGKYLMPGLIDMNVRLFASQELPLYLANGVTTVLNQDGQPAHLKWRNAVALGQMVGPNIVTTGPSNYRYKSEPDLRQVVANQAKAGFNAVYVQPGMAPGALNSAVTTSKQYGMFAVGQMPRGSNLVDVLKLHMMISHAEEFLSTSLNRPPDMKVAINQTAKQTAASQTPVIATLVTYTHILRQASDLKTFLARTPTQYLAPWQRDAWQPGTNEYQLRYSSRESIASFQNGLAIQKDLIRQLHQQGGIVLVGTDANNTGVVPGFSILEEIQNLARLGFTNYEAIRAATADSAAQLTQSKRLGTIAAGKQADLILLSGNPTKDLSVLSKPTGTMVAGRWYSADSLGKLLSAIPGQYAALLQKGTNATSSADAYETFLQENDPQRRMTNPLMLQLVVQRGEAGLSKFLNQLSSKDPRSILASENGVNQLGYWMLTAKKQAALAVKVFQVNVSRHPKSANMYDSLAEGYLNLGNKPKAIELYRKAVQVGPGFSNSVMMLKKLGAK